MTAPGSAYGMMGQVTDQGPRLELSLVQVVASALAAASGAVAASYLGVAGTVAGTAIFSVVATTATAVYTHSLSQTRSRLRQRAAANSYRPRPILDDLPENADGGVGPDAFAMGETALLPAVDRLWPTGADRGPSLDLRTDADRPVRWGRIALASLVVFAIVTTGVAVLELAAHRNLADLVRGRTGSGGTSIGTTVTTVLTPTAKQRARTPSPTPTPTRSPTHAPTSTPPTPVTETPSFTSPGTVGPTVSPPAPAGSPSALPTPTLSADPNPSVPAPAPPAAPVPSTTP